MTSVRQFSRRIDSFPNFIKPIYKGQQKQTIVISSFRINNSTRQIFHLALYQKHIQITSNDNQKFIISLEFEIKFSIQGNILYFSRQQDQEIELIFLDNDMELWRTQLSKRLCQKFNNVPFRIKKRISIRDLCAIYLAEQDRNDKGISDYMVVKTFRKSSLGNGKAYQDFKNQIDIMRNIRHQNLCQLLNIYQSQNSYYICMQHYEGGTLLDKHLREPLSISSIQDIMRQVLSGLNYLHLRGIVHRDIKPENILMQRQNSNEIAIIDFGLATYQNCERMLSKCGTPGYVAPQIFKSTPSAPYNQKCDIFSSGMLFYWLLTSKLPYNAKNEKQFKLQNYNFNFDQKQHPLLVKYSIQTIDLLKKMLKRDPRSRISAADGLQHPFFDSYKPCVYGMLPKYAIHKQESKFNF